MPDPAMLGLGIDAKLGATMTLLHYARMPYPPARLEQFRTSVLDTLGEEFVVVR